MHVCVAITIEQMSRYIELPCMHCSLKYLANR
jgi:hypothetical protein